MSFLSFVFPLWEEEQTIEFLNRLGGKMCALKGKQRNLNYHHFQFKFDIWFHEKKIIQ